MVLQPIVEGRGDEAAAPILLRRLAEEAEAWNVRIARPHRRRRHRLARKADLQIAVRIALLTADCAGVLVLFDADDDCPRERAPEFDAWARAAAGHVPCAVVMANREYEAWLLAGIESLRGTAGVRADAAVHPEPEKPRNTKGEMKQRMSGGTLPGDGGSGTADGDLRPRRGLSSLPQLPQARHGLRPAARRVGRSAGHVAAGCVAGKLNPATDTAQQRPSPGGRGGARRE